MQDYIDFVEKLAKDGEDEIFFNSGPTHAAIVMSRIFKYSKNVVKILCGGFSGAVSNDEEYLKYLDSFLKGGGKVQILAEQDLSKNNAKIFGVLRKYKSNVEIFTTKAKLYGDKQKEKRLHFTVGDDQMLRLETGIDDYTAQVNFGNKEEGKIFSSLFDGMFAKAKSTPIILA